ncbi:MAG: DUF1002 domain-containing protein [Eubacteriales bacterium]|nr:DUF1002 domain-containing protein [Eubacteriales bacterium]
MKMKRVLPLFMAAAVMATSVPFAASASDTADETAVQTEEGTAEVTEGTDGDTVTEGTGENGTDGAAVENGTGNDGTQTGDTEPVEEQTSEIIEGDQVDTDNVVTLGENLTEEQRAAMYDYFGTSADKVRTIIVTHADEVKYMEGIATAEQIGPTTNSCAYVEPTESGGIKVKTANLNYVTSTMIASTLTTAGMENCNVIAACPFEVSGTGALTGIIMAYETASGENLDEGKKEAAMEELITTGNLSDAIGSELATEVMNEVKTEIIDQGLTDPEEIGAAVDEIAANHDVTLTEDQRQQIVSLMEKISQYDYDLDAIKKTLDSLNGKVGALENVWNSIKSFFVGSGDGILSETNDAALGQNVLTDSTVSEGGFKDGLITRILNLFKKDE